MKHLFALILVCTFISACASRSGSHSGDGTSQTTHEPNPLVPKNFGPNYKYNELMIKDYDEMTAMVQSLVRQSRDATAKPDSGGDGAAVEYLGRALKLIFSRPDSDNMVAKLVGEVRRELQGFNSYEDTVTALADEALEVVKDKNNTVIGQSTALVLLENIMGEVKPEVYNGSTAFRRLVERVRDANLKITDEVKKDRRLRGMFRTKNPSDEARDIIKGVDAKAKKRK